MRFSKIDMIVVFFVLVLTGSTLWGFAHYFSILPLFDTAALVGVLDRDRYTISLFDYIFQEHNEHRIFLTKAVLLADYCFFGGVKGFSYFVLFSTNTACFLLITTFFWKTNFSLRRLWLCVLFGLFFSLIQLRNFDSVFQLQFFLVNLFTLLAFFQFTTFQGAFLAGDEAGKLKSFALCALFSVLAAFNMGNGLLTPAILLIAMLLFARDWRYWIPFLGIFILVVILYFHEWSPPGKPTVNTLPPNYLLNVLRYVVHFVGGLFRMNYLQHWDLVILATSSLFAYVSLVVKTLIAPKSASKPLIFATLVFCFVVGSALAAASGRMGSNYSQAMTSRYFTIALIYWATLISVLFSFGNPKSKSARYALYFFAFFMFAVIIKRQSMAIHYCHKEGEKRRLSEAALAAGFYEFSSIPRDFPFVLSRSLKVLKEKNLSMYSEFYWNRLTTIDSVHSASKSASSDTQFLTTQATQYQSEDGAKQGWIVWGVSTSKIPCNQLIQVLDEEGNIVGFSTAMRNLPEELQMNHPAHEHTKVYWVAFIDKTGFQLSEIRLATRRSLFRAAHEYAVKLGEMTVLKFASTPELHSHHACPHARVAHAENGWVPDGFFSGIQDPKPETQIWGTWTPSGGDASTGTLEFSVEISSSDSDSGSLLVPLLLGPDKAKSEVYLESANGSHRVILDLKDLPSHVWIYFDLSSFMTPGAWRIVAKDNGQGWGQWLAIGSPVISDND